MDPLIDPTTKDYTGSRTMQLANAVYLRLMTPKGSWWADPNLGSRLHELEREKDLTRIYKLAKQYSEQALQPILDDNRALAIDVTAQRIRKSVCLLSIRVHDLSGELQYFEHPVRVS